MSTYDALLQTCIAGLTPAERTRVSDHVLRRIVWLCASATTPFDANEDPPGLQYIKAWTIRPHDVIWRPNTRRFAAVIAAEGDPLVGLMHVTFNDGTAHWYATDDVAEIPSQRSTANEWNQRCLAAAV